LADVFVVRHGQTDWNVARRFQGHTDIALNANGLRQVQQLAVRLAREPLAAIYASDLVRAHATALASATLHGLPVHAMADLRERHFGVFEGLTASEIEQRYPEWYRRWISREPDFAAHGGESLEGVSTRVLATLCQIARRHRGRAVLVVTHGGALDLIYRHVIGVDLKALRTWETPNAAINQLHYDNGTWRILTWADEEHLS